MAISLSLLRSRPLFVSLALLASACGGDDDKDKAEPAEQPAEENEAGAPAVAPSYPPALSPEDCSTATSEITLSQPDGAAVWGGLVLLEFTVDGAKLDSFDVQAFDPSLGAWTNNYVGTQATGQREDGSYFIAVSPYFSDDSKDKEMKLRVRPSQQGCPDADWTETETFTAGDPLVGTSWQAQIPAALFSGQFELQRQSIPAGDVLPSSPLTLGDATVSVVFGKKGSFDEVVRVPLSTDADVPYDGCLLSLTFSGTYSLILRQQYGGMTLAISQQTLSSFKGTTCDLPAVDEMGFANMDPMAQPMRLSAYTQNVSINYLPTLYAEPAAPIWQNNSFGQVFQQLPDFLTYVTAKESGSVSGYVYPQDVSFERL
jgi:hypothetical protein